MKILVVGGGGRENALIWKISQSKRVKKIWAAPGNVGSADLAESLDIKTANVVELADFAKEEQIDLTVVGPEQPLALGIADEFNRRNLKIFGPSQKAAMIESSKAFAKEFMKKNSIPTAEYQVFDNPLEALQNLEQAAYPRVLKVDGLAAGKGVFICSSFAEAQEPITAAMVEKKFGHAGNRLVVEEFLSGQELSFMVISDGKRVVPLVTSQDYKKLLDRDEGPNTGGMGAISPAPQVDEELFARIMKTIIRPTIDGLRFENREFRGVLYAGLMVNRGEPKVLEFNARFGDPETQAIMLRLKSDLVDLLEGSADGNLFDCPVEWSENVSACVVLAGKGYPQKTENGARIKGLERAKALGLEVFHAGTALEDGELVTAGGRVLNVCAQAPTMRETIGKIYDGISFITFSNMYFRQDIGRTKQ